LNPSLRFDVDGVIDLQVLWEDGRFRREPMGTTLVAVSVSPSRKASSDAITEDWGRVALAVDQKAGRDPRFRALGLGPSGAWASAAAPSPFQDAESYRSLIRASGMTS